ncbi:MAG: hypothetical protein IPI40_13660 [Betaproteobacteria bacterium]|nr:hypothetical protein [Betaproteobacteria bacterium]
MPLAAPLRPFALLLFAMLCPGLAHALSETYEGVLLPDNLEGPIPIVVELRDVGSILTGNVKAAFPLNGSASIASGEKQGRSVQHEVVLEQRRHAAAVYGSCQPSMFAGKIYLLPSGTPRRGSFHHAQGPGQVKKKHLGAPCRRPRSSPARRPTSTA